MARYTADSKERVRDAVDLVDLIGSRTELRRAGVDRYTGLCPFHDERTPSFGVTPSKKFYYCFGCQAAGDPFTFVREMEGLDFVAALEFLADRYGVKLELEAEDPQAAARRRRRERLLSLLERSCGYYERYLWGSKEAARAREHLLGRGLDEAMLREFRVGYAPSAWDRVLVASRQGGFTEAELYDAGLAQRSRETPGRVYDRFRARIMFPLCDNRGRVLGFGARTMNPDQPAKYLNTSDNEIYHKGRHLYGLHLARAVAAKTGSVIVCEGYTDVVAMHQAGLRNAVGLMGTALTDEQLAELRRLAPSVALALDADTAGQDAMVRAAGMAARHQLELRVIELPAGSDPAELLQRDGAGALAGLAAGAVAFVRFRVERVLAAGDLSTAEGRDRMLGELAVTFAGVAPGALRVELERLVVAKLGVSEQTVGQLLAPGGARPSAGRRVASPAGFTLDARERSERAFLALCLALPDAGRRALAELDIEIVFTGELTRRAAAHLLAHIDEPGGHLDDPEDSRLAALLAELAVRATEVPAQPAQLEVGRLQLELALVEREILVARAAGLPGQSELAARRRDKKAAVERALTDALEQTAGGRD
ncbi:MAG: DNA primase [Solirubrobacteraceae bacterium]